jgi:hypothetical protein
MQVKDGLAMATVVEEPTVAPPLVAITVIKEGQTVTEATASQVILDPPAEAGASGADMVMVPADDDSAPAPPAGSMTSQRQQRLSLHRSWTLYRSRTRRAWRRVGTRTTPASGPVTSTPLNSRATTGRCWMWQRGGPPPPPPRRVGSGGGGPRGVCGRGHVPAITS